MNAKVPVAAGILLRETPAGSEYMLAQRPPGKAYAGYWEFPGGKVEDGESAHAALVRELAEELGISVERSWPWLACEYVYPHAHVHIRFFRIPAWRGDPQAHEHTGLCWTRIGDEPAVSPVLPANGRILRALTVPARYAISNAAGNGVDGELQRIARGLAGGLRLIQMRDKSLPAAERERLARGIVALAAGYPGTRVLINDDEELARKAGAQGVHLSAASLMRCPVRPDFDWVAASCHTADELARAAELGIDFAVLGPVFPTTSHEEAEGIGWEAFSRLVENSPIPVFALGGVRDGMLETARRNGAHGIAQLSSWG